MGLAELNKTHSLMVQQGFGLVLFEMLISLMVCFFPDMQNFSSASINLLLELINSSNWVTGIFNLAINTSFQ